MLPLTACGTHWVCPATQIASDGHGRVVFHADVGLVALDTRTGTLRPVGVTPKSLQEDDRFRFGVSRDERVYIGMGDRAHPNRATIVDLRSGGTKALGNDADVPEYLKVIGNAGELFFAQQSQPDIRVADLKSAVVHPTLLLRGRRTRIGAPSELAFNRRGELCVLEHDAPTIECFARGARGNAAPSVVVDVGRVSRGAIGDAEPLSQTFLRFARIDGDALRGFAAAARGDTYFSRANPDALLRADRTGRIAIVRGDATGLASPEGVAVDLASAVYVANPGNGTVTVYSPNALGNTHPVRTIAGDETHLRSPHAVAVDADGTVFVLDGPREHNGLSAPPYHIFAFAAGATGNRAPLRTYDVRADCFTNDHL